MFLTRMEHIVAATLAPHAFRAAVPATAAEAILAEASLAEASCAFRATMATDAAARAPDVTSAQGEWEEEPREGGGATEKKEATPHPPDSSPLVLYVLQALPPLLLLRLGYRDSPAIHCPLPFPKRPLRYACEPFLPCTWACPKLIHPRFLLGYLCAIILYPLAPAHIVT